MGLVVSFIDINDDTEETYGRHWVIEDPELEKHLRHLAHEHFGEPMLEATKQEAEEGVRRYLAGAEG
jgi:hypothetical protein